MPVKKSRVVINFLVFLVNVSLILVFFQWPQLLDP